MTQTGGVKKGDPARSDENDGTNELISFEEWPGQNVDYQAESEMSIDYSNDKNLHYILQSAKQILSADEGKKVAHRPWTNRYRKTLSPAQLVRVIYLLHRPVV